MQWSSWRDVILQIRMLSKRLDREYERENKGEIIYEYRNLWRSKKTYIVNFQLRNEELISNFSDVTDEEKINIIKEGIKIACQKKNSTEIENLMLSISFFRLYDRSEFIEDYIKLSKKEFHEEHETIASYF